MAKARQESQKVQIKRRSDRKKFTRTYRSTVPSLKSKVLEYLSKKDINVNKLLAEYPPEIVEMVNKRLIHYTISKIEALARFEFEEVEPVRLTMEDVNPNEDARTFPVRWNDWNQRRGDALLSLKNEIHGLVGRMLPGLESLFSKLIELATFEFEEPEPVRLTMEDVNPNGYGSLMYVHILQEDARTFPGRWDAWNRRRLHALRSLKNEILTLYENAYVKNDPDVSRAIQNITNIKEEERPEPPIPQDEEDDPAPIYEPPIHQDEEDDPAPIYRNL